MKKRGGGVNTRVGGGGAPSIWGYDDWILRGVVSPESRGNPQVGGAYRYGADAARHGGDEWDPTVCLCLGS